NTVALIAADGPGQLRGEAAGGSWSRTLPWQYFGIVGRLWKRCGDPTGSICSLLVIFVFVTACIFVLKILFVLPVGGRKIPYIGIVTVVAVIEPVQIAPLEFVEQIIIAIVIVDTAPVLHAREQLAAVPRAPAVHLRQIIVGVAGVDHAAFLVSPRL